MGSPYIGEIRLFAGTFAPQGWQLCDGSILDIASNTSLYALLTNLYGGDGQTTFAVPDLRGRVPQHVSVAYPLAQMGGVESVTLTQATVGPHVHSLNTCGQTVGVATPSDQTLIADENTVDKKGAFIYAPPGSDNKTTMSSAIIGSYSGGDPHENRQPYLALTYIIALQGIFPPKAPPSTN